MTLPNPKTAGAKKTPPVRKSRPSRKEPPVHIQDDINVYGIAQEYKDTYPWVDQAAMEANMAVHAGYWAAHEAGKKLISAMGQGRTAGRFTVLRLLFLTGGNCLTQNEISRRLMITAATVTYLIDGLAREGLALRRVYEKDRRTMEVLLTPKGKEVCLRLIPAMAKLAETFCRGFTEEEKHTLVRLMLKFWSNANSDAFDEAAIAAILAEVDSVRTVAAALQVCRKLSSPGALQV